MEKKKSVKKPAAPKYSLFEAWLGYIYKGNTCPAGIRALEYLRSCLAAGKITDAEVWDGASDEIKAAFRTQFGFPTSSPEVKALEKIVSGYDEALDYLPKACPSRTSVEAEKLKVQAKITKLTPKSYRPRAFKGQYSSLLSVQWPPDPEAKK